MEQSARGRAVADPVPLHEQRPHDTHRLLELLGFRPEDERALVAGFEHLTRQDREVIRERGLALAQRVGQLSERTSVLAEKEEAPHHAAGRGYLSLLALVEVAPLVHAELLRRGLDVSTAWKSLSDLGQQVHIHRLVHGTFGFSAAEWVAKNYSGSLVWLGRLQFTIEHDSQWGWVLGCHIPETGPLRPEEVDASLARLPTELLPAFPEFNFSRVTCHSWLLDQQLVARLDPESNMARFARRFTPYGTPTPGRRDALFFAFHVETRDDPAIDLTALPHQSSLQRAIITQLTESDIVVQPGWMPLPRIPSN